MLGVVLVERARRRAELEDRELALAAIAESERHHRGADPRADVERAGGGAGAARPVEAVHVAMPDHLAEGELVEARDGDLSAVGVAGEDERDAVAPEPVGLFADVREPDRRQVAAHPPHGLVAARVTRERVVEPDDLEAPRAAERERRVPVRQDLDAGSAERAHDLAGAGPVIVVAEHGERRRLEPREDVDELVEVALSVTDEVAGERDQVRPLGVGERHGAPLDRERRDPPEVEVGQVDHPRLDAGGDVGLRAGEAANRDPRRPPRGRLPG